MGAKTGIEWTDATWNPILGCSRVSEGCRNCYAEGIAGRFGGGKETVYSGLTKIVNGRAVWTGQIKETRQLFEPLKWRTPKRVFVNSMSDLFHENMTDEQRDRIFAVMALCPQHTFQVLTKRPERMAAYFSDPGYHTEMIGIEAELISRIGRHTPDLKARWPLPLFNVWLGVSVENQDAANKRIPALRNVDAAVRFLSCEPLLGPLEFSDVTNRSDCVQVLGKQARDGIDWVICGGESGPGARPMDPAWMRSLRDQCAAASVAFFAKQMGSAFGPHKGHELPDDLNIKQFPKAGQ